MPIAVSTTGSRLAYVVVPIKGTVTRPVVKFEEIPSGKDKNGQPKVQHKMRHELKEQAAGFMVYFPRGHAIRLRGRDLKKYGLNKPAKIINMQGLNDPNSPIGKLIARQDNESRSQAFQMLEKNVIALATAKSGKILFPEEIEGAMDGLIPEHVNQDYSDDDDVQLAREANPEQTQEVVIPEELVINPKRRSGRQRTR